MPEDRQGIWAATSSVAAAVRCGKPGQPVTHFQSPPMLPYLVPQAAHPDKPAPPVTALAQVRTDVSVIPTSTGESGAGRQAMGSCRRFASLLKGHTGPWRGHTPGNRALDLLFSRSFPSPCCLPVCSAAPLPSPAILLTWYAGNQLVVHRPLQLDERMVALAAAISIDYGARSKALLCRVAVPVMCSLSCWPPEWCVGACTGQNSPLPHCCCRLLQPAQLRRRLHIQ